MSEALPETLEGGTDEFGIEAVRELIAMIEQTDITELLIERGTSKLHVKRGTPAAAPGHAAMSTFPLALSVPPMAAHGIPHAPAHVPHMSHPASYAPAPVPSAPPYATSHSEVAPEEPAIPEGHLITSPMVGTFYAAPSPKDPAFAHEGDEVHAGDTVGIVEAMKMMNEIETDVGGKVLRILVKNEQPVEYGQPLMVIAPH